MNKLIVRAIGHLSEPWQKQAVRMYEERLNPFFRLEIVELPEGHKGAAKPDVNRTKAAEAESLLKGLPKKAWVVALDETGKTVTSPAFAQALAEWTENGRPAVFLIGGSWGLNGEVRAQANVILSLGSMTLPHALARIVLLEQLYRAAMIQSGKTYHK